MVAGMVPCWEAIGLLLLGLSAGYPLQGLILVLSFVSGSLLVMIMLILFADFILRYFTIGGFLGYIFNMAMNLIVLAAGLRLLWQSGSTG
jgi:ABC-type nickel/cobalt efflux system permease component RcnA